MNGQHRDGCDALSISAREVFGELPVEPICVRVSVAVKLTGISRSTLYELIGDGELEVAKVGRSTFIRYDSLKRLFERQ
ncbi:helix-turn-helix domain-containing protein [Sphingopyxis sp. MSC1_008]|jgi:excisionase family DNA binding protein|uniref:helix-turn-helix domain-containing protein n=1 Tax=Sphingopyxis sp. MSC1_008 TaxID=2909265 RepID=UPI0032C11D81